MTERAVVRDRGGGYLSRPAPSGLADVIDIVLDKGIVIDAYLRVSLLGIELLTVDARLVVASVDTYLRFAEATNRLELEEVGPPSLADMAVDGAGKAIEAVAANVVEHKIEGVVESVEDKIEGAVESAGDAIEGAAEKVKDFAGTVAGKTRDFVERVTPDGDEEDGDSA